MSRPLGPKLEPHERAEWRAWCATQDPATIAQLYKMARATGSSDPQVEALIEALGGPAGLIWRTHTTGAERRVRGRSVKAWWVREKRYIRQALNLRETYTHQAYPTLAVAHELGDNGWAHLYAVTFGWMREGGEFEPGTWVYHDGTITTSLAVKGRNGRWYIPPQWPRYRAWKALRARNKARREADVPPLLALIRGAA